MSPTPADKIHAHSASRKTNREIEISSAIEGRAASRKDAPWQFPLLQRRTCQNIPDCVKRNSTLVAFGKSLP